MKGVVRYKVLNFLFLFAILFSIGFASALSGASNSNITILVPTVSGTLNGATALINASLVAGYEAENYTTCYVYLLSASTDNSSWTLIKTYKNYTAPNIFNATFNSAIIEDSNDYIINFTLWNGTTYIGAVRSGITVDNTIPQAPNTLDPSTNTLITSSSTQTLAGTVTHHNTTGCTYTIYRENSPSDSDSASDSTAYSGTNCSFTKKFSSSSDNGNYYWTITASDGTNTTSSVTNVLSVQIAPNPGSLPPGVYTSNGNTFTVGSNGTISTVDYLPWIIIGIIIVIGTTIIVIVRKKK